jgi:hypothetical protein
LKLAQQAGHNVAEGWDFGEFQGVAVDAFVVDLLVGSSRETTSLGTSFRKAQAQAPSWFGAIPNALALVSFALERCQIASLV